VSWCRVLGIYVSPCGFIATFFIFFIILLTSCGVVWLGLRTLLIYPENPTLEPNTKRIGWSVTEIGYGQVHEMAVILDAILNFENAKRWSSVHPTDSWTTWYRLGPTEKCRETIVTIHCKVRPKKLVSGGGGFVAAAPLSICTVTTI